MAQETDSGGLQFATGAQPLVFSPPESQRAAFAGHDKVEPRPAMPRMAQGPLDTSPTPKCPTLPRRHAVRGPVTFLGAHRRQSTGLSPSRGAPPLTQSPRLANQVQPPPVRARFRALGENPRLPWPVNHFNAFLKPERINRPPASGTQYGRPRGPACPLGGGAEKGKMALAPLGLARMQITTTKITLPHTSVRLPES